MALTLATPIALARTILNDPNAVTYSAADLLSYANDALDAMIPAAPHLFHVHTTVTCVAGTKQAVTATGAMALKAVHRVQGGNAVLPADKQALDAYDPTWHTAASAAAVNWAPDLGDDLGFFVSPPAAAGQVLEVIILQAPAEYGVNDDTGIPDGYAPAIADYIVYRAESRDAEHVNSNRAAQYLASFNTRMGT